MPLVQTILTSSTKLLVGVSLLSCGVVLSSEAQETRTPISDTYHSVPLVLADYNQDCRIDLADIDQYFAISAARNTEWGDEVCECKGVPLGSTSDGTPTCPVAEVQESLLVATPATAACPAPSVAARPAGPIQALW